MVVQKYHQYNHFSTTVLRSIARTHVRSHSVRGRAGALMSACVTPTSIASLVIVVCPYMQSSGVRSAYAGTMLALRNTACLKLFTTRICLRLDICVLAG